MFLELLDALPEALLAYTQADLRLVYANATAERLFGRTAVTRDDEPLAWLERVHPDDREAVRRSLEARRPGVEPAALGGFRFLDRAGKTRFARGTLRELVVPAGARAGRHWLERIADVTDEHLAELSVLQERRLFATVLHHLGAAVAITDLEGRIDWANEEAARLSGRTPEAVRGKLMSELLEWHERPPRPYLEVLDEALRAGPIDAGVRRYDVPGEGTREIDWWLGPLLGVGDRPGRVVGIGRDVTLESQAARAKRQSDERFGHLLRNLPGVPWLYDVALGGFAFIGPGFEALFGRPPPTGANAVDELSRWVHPEDATYADAPRRALRDPSVASVEAEYRIVRPDGTTRWAHTHAVAVRDEHGEVLQLAGFTADDSARHEAARQLRVSEERLRRMSEAMGEAFFLVGAGGRELLYVNDAIAAITGISRERVGEDPVALFDIVYVDDRARVRTLLARLQRDAAPQGERFELRIVRADGALRWLEAWTYAIFDATGQVRQFVGTLRDVTERKGAEVALRERSEQLERSLREKSALLAEVHHRVKNNLQSIAGLVHLMAAQAHRRPLADTISDLERRIHAMALVHETLYRSSDLGAVDMQTYLKSLGLALRTALRPATGAIELVVAAEGVKLSLEAAVRWGFIANELVGNAIKHAFRGRDHGRVAVRLRAEAGELTLRVSDDGIGLPRTLDLRSEATLGLRLVCGLAEQMDGHARRVASDESAIEVVCPAEPT